ncbi:hypothetical protein ROTAS13_01645 [Roseomonas sp. TAS13]|nr:hypothetical protein ROTAS13_01645 [Roseomonas sp. TAS13]
MEMVGQPVPLQPGDRRLQLRQGHLRPPLVAQHALQRGVVGVVGALAARRVQRALVLHHLRRHKLADPRPQPPLGDRGRLEQLLLRLAEFGAPLRQVRPRAQGGQPQRQRVAFQRHDAFPLPRILPHLLQPERQHALARRLGRAGAGALLLLHAPAELAEERVVRVEDQRLLLLIGPGLVIDPRGAGHHLLQPGAGADMRQRRHDRDLGRVQPLIGHGHRHQDRGLRPQAEGRQGLVRVALVGGGEAQVLRLPRRHPAPQHVEIEPRAALVRRHHQQLAEAARALPRHQPPATAPLRAQVARRVEGMAQQGFREAGAQRGEQRGPRRLVGVEAGDAVRAQLVAVLVAPAGLAIQRAEGHGQHGALGQRLGTGVADHRPPFGVQLHLARARLRAAAVGQPEDAPAVRPLQRAGEQQADAGAFQQGQDGAGPGARLVLLCLLRRGHKIDVGQRRQVVHLVHHQQRAAASELRQVQVRGGRDALIGRDVAGQATARVRRVVGRAYGKGVAQRPPPEGIGEGLLGLQAQAVARHHPADPLHDPGCDEAAGGNDRQERLTPAGRYGGQDVACLRLAVGDCLHHPGEALLVGAEPAGHSGGRSKQSTPRH